MHAGRWNTRHILHACGISPFSTGYVSLFGGTERLGGHAGMGVPPSASTALQLVADAPHAAWGEPLNGQMPWYGEAHPASQVPAPHSTLLPPLQVPWYGEAHPFPKCRPVPL